MNADTVTIRQLRTDFRSVKRRIEQHGEVVVTDHGEPAYVVKLLPAPAKKRPLFPTTTHGSGNASPKGLPLRARASSGRRNADEGGGGSR